MSNKLEKNNLKIILELIKNREEIFIKAVEELKKARELEKEFAHLAKTTKKPCEYHIKEALIRYIEDMEDIRDVKKYIERKKQGKVKYYTSEEVEKELKQYYASRKELKQ